MIVEKTASQKDNAKRPLYFFNSARAGLKCILEKYAKQGNATLLLPGYIGYSKNEGSGIYDPVIETGIEHRFYHMNRDLSIDVSSLKTILEQIRGTKLVLLVHYFGYPDCNIDSIVSICRKNGAIIIEDAAHALYTDFIDHLCGNYGEYVIYSLHKMLPFEKGGLLKVNGVERDEQWKSLSEEVYPLFSYDLYKISFIRKRNAKVWYELLGEYTDVLFFLRPFSDEVTLQTVPILIKRHNRDELYFKLNEAGFGAVSLYHTMIDPIQKAGDEDAVWLSKHIMNLPVHQDVTERQITEMSVKLLELLK